MSTMKGTRIRKGLFISLIIGLIIGHMINQMQSEDSVPEFVFSYAENQSEDYPTTLGGYKFAELVEERTEGRIKILVKAEGVLGDEKKVVQQLQFGGIDFARISLSQVAHLIPQWYILQMPYLYKDAEHMWEVLEGPIGQDFLDLSQAVNLVALSWYDAGARNFYNRVKPIKCLEDMEGLSIRVQESQLMVDLIEALGAIPVPLPYEEVYASLERGRIDGAENNWPSYESRGHYKVAPYYTVDEHIRIPEVQIVSQVTWEKLSLEDREIIQECAQESALYEREIWKEREKQSEVLLRQKGVEVVQLPEEEKVKFRQAVQKVYEQYCEGYEEILQLIIQEVER